MIQIAVVEDNDVHRERLEGLIPTALREPFVISSFSDREAFLGKMEREGKVYDIVFMDIEMGGHSGIETAREALRRYPLMQVIYISQYLEYISPVYETEHLYFIYKPELEAYLEAALKKAVKAISESRSGILEVSWNKIKFYIPQEEIVYMERMLRTTVICTAKEVYKTADGLQELLEKLKGSFVRCQRSYVVNLRHVASYHSTYFEMADGKQISISRNYQDSVKKKLSEYISRG